jgi:hypothetical protein
MSGTIAAFLPSFPAFARMEWNPSFDVTENKDGYVFKADIPDVKKEGLETRARVISRPRFNSKEDVMHKMRIFISDVHMSTNGLGAYKHNFHWLSDQQIGNLTSFLDSLVVRKPDELVIVGDLLDNWVCPHPA